MQFANTASVLSIPNLVDFRRAVQENGFATAATTISSISGGNDGPETFKVIVNGVWFDAIVGYVHPVAFKTTYVGAEVLIGVFIPHGYINENFLPEDHNPDAPVTFTVRITSEKAEGYRGYDYVIEDDMLRAT